MRSPLSKALNFVVAISPYCFRGAILLLPNVVNSASGTMGRMRASTAIAALLLGVLWHGGR
ncbi:hypothetical protein B0H14DRAFT_2758859 [Mycena olivaceomarginata]|nr:hypothetical protein B0H14DRAFT_2758859 [Mycena olivaceomarginata]